MDKSGPFYSRLIWKDAQAKYYSISPQPEQNGSCWGAEAIWSCGRKEINTWMETEPLKVCPHCGIGNGWTSFPLQQRYHLTRLVCTITNWQACWDWKMSGTACCCTWAEPGEEIAKAHRSHTWGCTEAPVLTQQLPPPDLPCRWNPFSRCLCLERHRLGLGQQAGGGGGACFLLTLLGHSSQESEHRMG